MASITSLQIDRTVKVAGQTFRETFVKSDDNLAAVEPDGGVAAAKTGTLTTRTDNDTGVIAAQVSHGIVSTNKVSVFWTDPTTGAYMARSAMTATVSGNNVTVDGGSGDSLPLATTALKLIKGEEEVLAFDGDNLSALALYSKAPGVIEFLDGSAAVLLTRRLLRSTSGNVYTWDDEQGDVNPLAGTEVASIRFTHNNSAAANLMRAAALTA